MKTIGSIGFVQSVRSVAVRFGRPKLALNVLLALCLCYVIVHHRRNDGEELSDDSVNSIADDQEVIHNVTLVNKAKEESLEQGIPKKILYWTGYYDRKDMVFGFGKDPFVQAGCKVTNCWATDDRSQLNQSDAIIFHAGDFKANDLPAHRLPHQRYIFYLFETLPHGRHLPYFSSLTDNYFNWTMTHRRDSDVYIAEPYGALRRKANSIAPEQLPPNLSPGDKPPLPSKLMTYPVPPDQNKKKKMVAWFCSNVHTHGGREFYIKELAKHVQVDIYGKCGNMTCQPKNSPQCNNLLDGYKFYMSAENSLCPDYVSEKFYRAFKTGVVPIVYGGADYSQYAPPNSYITVADFASPKELADYLHLLDRNEAMYLKYFEWRKDWEVVTRPLNGWCDLCEKLNEPHQEAKSYESMAKWWFDDLPCYPGTSFLKSVRVESTA